MSLIILAQRLETLIPTVQTTRLHFWLIVPGEVINIIARFRLGNTGVVGNESIMIFDGRETLVLAILTLFLGKYLNHKVSFLKNYNIPGRLRPSSGVNPVG